MKQSKNKYKKHSRATEVRAARNEFLKQAHLRKLEIARQLIAKNIPFTFLSRYVLVVGQFTKPNGSLSTRAVAYWPISDCWRYRHDKENRPSGYKGFLEEVQNMSYPVPKVVEQIILPVVQPLFAEKQQLVIEPIKDSFFERAKKWFDALFKAAT